MSLWPLIAIVVFALPMAGLWFHLFDEDGRYALEWRDALAWAAVGWAVYSIVGVELLSLGAGHDPFAPRSGHLTRGWLLLWWTPAVAWAAFAILWRRESLGALAARPRAALANFGRGERAAVAVIAACLAVTLLIALVAAPNTWDSMTYHLTRVAIWLKLGGVAHYATNIEAQLYQPPGAEYLIAQLQAVAGGDRAAALVQWSAYALSIAVVSRGSSLLGAGRRGQLIAALLAATAPMALMQATSTQNDLLFSLWLMIAAVSALGAWQGGERASGRAFAGAVALGLAVVTKGTAPLIGAPVALLLAFAAVRGAGVRRAAAVAAAAVLVTAAINLGPWLRNAETYGTPIATGSDERVDYSNDRVTPATLFSNLLRNAAIYAGTPSERINELPTDAVRSTLSAAGIDPDDPATTFGGRPFEVGKSGPHESHAASTVLFLLAVWAVTLALLRGPPRRRAWAAMVVAQSLLFAAAVTWQPWHARLHLPMLLLSVPLVAVALDELRGSRVRNVALLAACALTPVLLAYNVMRPLVGPDSILTTPRVEQYFQQRPSLTAQFEAIVGFAAESGIERVGVTGGPDDWEYPFFVLAPRAVARVGGEPAGGRTIRFGDVLVANGSRRYRTGDELPAMVVCLGCNNLQRDPLTAAGFEPVELMVKQKTGINFEKGMAFEIWVRPYALPRATPNGA